MSEPEFGNLTAHVKGLKESVENEDDKEIEKHLHQYQVNGNSFQTVGKTIKRLPAGFYSIGTDAHGAIVFSLHEVVTDDLIRLPDSKSDEVIAEIQQFWTLKDKFDAYGFNYKRGILMWGPPGSGKTATTTWLIMDLVARGGVVFYGDCDPRNLEAAIKEFREVESERPLIVVFEDLDSIVERYESYVLNILDGENSTSNVVFIATTNYPEKLDKRIINRPSRFDFVVKIDVPNKEARLTYLKWKKLNLTDDELETWANDTQNFSIAHLKELIVGTFCYGRPYKEVLNRLKSMAKPVSSENNGGGMGFGLNGSRDDDD